MKKIALRVALVMACVILTVFSVSARAAETLPQEIPLQNPGFENELQNWSVSTQFKNQVEIVKSPTHSGDNAVKIDATTKTNSPFIGNAARNLIGDATYKFSVWARVAPGAPAVEAGVKMENYDDQGRNTSGLYGRLKLPANGEWKQITVTNRIDADTTRSNLLLRVFGKGAVIFDDANFSLVKNPPAITVTGDRMAIIKPGRDANLTYDLFFREPWKEKFQPEITSNLRPAGIAVDAESKQTILGRPYLRGGQDRQNFGVTITIPKLQPGEYLLDFGYRRDGKFIQTDRPLHIFVPVPNRKPKNLTDTGTLLWHGKPFFPIGMYHPQDKYQLLAENGFNAVQGNSTLNIDDFKKSLDEAQKYGLAVDVPFYANGQVAKNLENSLEKIKKFADHPAVLDWKIKDEPDIASNESLAAEVPAAYRAFKKADPNHPIELTLAHDATLGFWSNFADIVQIDRYPVRSATGPSNLTPVASFSRNAKLAMQPWQNLTFVVQSGWTLDLSTQPTVDQARSMVYLALVSGAKGIYWYSMSEGSGWDLTKTPLWPHMKDINAEISDIAQPIMLGDIVPLRLDNSQIYATARKYQNKLYIYFTNPYEKETEMTLIPTKLPRIKDGAYIKTAFTDANTKIKVAHSKDVPNSITVKVGKLQSGTMVFEY